MAAELLKPDLNIYIDISPEVSMKRLGKGRNSMELYETSENLINVKAKYAEAIELLKFKENIFITDGNRSTELIAADIWKEVSQLAVSINPG